MADPYKTLGLAADASAADIQRAYRKLAKKHHPDVNPGDATAEARFKEITGANAILSDPEKRAQFDRGEIDGEGQAQAPRPSYRDQADGPAGARYGRRGSASGGWDDDQFTDLFGSMFGAGRSGFGASTRGRDHRYSLQTSFLDAVNGATLRLDLPGDQVLDVRVPVGCESGQVLRLRGRGEIPTGGGERGDALIEIGVSPHPFFVRDGQTLRLSLPVSVSEAVLGARIQAPTPSGRVWLRIPPHSDSGSELRLRGRGVPTHGGLAAGDLLVTLRVMIGAPDAALDDFMTHWTPDTPRDPRHALEASL